MYSHHLHPRLRLPADIAEFLFQVSEQMLRHAAKAYRLRRQRPRPRVGNTLRPGAETPLWNELRAALRPHLRDYGTQVNLGRMLGLSRQQINSFTTRGTRMPDAERTLQLLAWLAATRRGRRPS